MPPSDRPDDLVHISAAAREFATRPQTLAYHIQRGRLRAWDSLSGPRRRLVSRADVDALKAAGWLTTYASR